MQRAGQDILTTIMLAFGSVGLEGEDAIHAVRGFRSLIHGFVSLESTDGFAMPYEIEKASTAPSPPTLTASLLRRESL
jgi:hypothetical protein